MKRIKQLASSLAIVFLLVSMLTPALAVAAPPPQGPGPIWTNWDIACWMIMYSGSSMIEGQVFWMDGSATISTFTKIWISRGGPSLTRASLVQALTSLGYTNDPLFPTKFVPPAGGINCSGWKRPGGGQPPGLPATNPVPVVVEQEGGLATDTLPGHAAQATNPLGGISTGGMPVFNTGPIALLALIVGGIAILGCLLLFKPS